MLLHALTHTICALTIRDNHNRSDHSKNFQRIAAQRYVVFKGSLLVVWIRPATWLHFVHEIAVPISQSSHCSWWDLIDISRNTSCTVATIHSLFSLTPSSHPAFRHLQYVKIWKQGYRLFSHSWSMSFSFWQWLGNECFALLQSLKYRVFCDLWRKGYYLTNGLKYGGDYLVYPGTVYQASYIYKGWSFLYRYKNYSLVPPAKEG